MEDLKSKGYPEKLATKLHQNNGVVKVGNLLFSNLACHFPRVLGQGCRFVSYTFSETKPEMVSTKYLFPGFGGLIQGQIYNPVGGEFFGLPSPPNGFKPSSSGVSGASKKVTKKPAAMKSKRTFIFWLLV